MPKPNDQVRAARLLLREVCALLAHCDDAVLVGGWVPDLLFPNAMPPHPGSIDVDFALRLQQAAFDKIVAMLHRDGFYQGENKYQFFKKMTLEGRQVTAKLDLLTSTRHHEAYFAGSATAPQAVHGADLAFRDNSSRVIDDAGNVPVRVAGIVAFLVMKSLALAERAKPKDAFDIHFCLENYPEGLPALAQEFRRFGDDPLLQEARQKLASKFRSEEDDGPRMAADVEGAIGDARAMRKLAIYTRMSDFLTLCLNVGHP